MVEFGRFAAENRGKRGLRKPETFNFLGFVHISGRTRTGRFQLRRKTRRDRMRAKLSHGFDLCDLSIHDFQTDRKQVGER